MISIPQVPQSVFPGGERGIGVELVVDFYVFVDQYHNFVQEIVVYLGDEWGVGILHTHEVFIPIGIEHYLAAGASGHVDNDIYAGLQFEDELYAILAGA